MDTWIKQRQILAAQGAQVEAEEWDVDALDTILDTADQADTSDRDARAAAITQMMNQLGG
jgi:hypothetical protein